MYTFIVTMTDTLIHPSKKVEKREYFVTIDSRDRDRNMWPSSSYFEVKCQGPNGFRGANLPTKFLNVRCIELISAIYPNTNDVLNEMYLYLTVPEIDGTFEATNLEGMKAIAKLVPHKIHGSFIHANMDDYHNPRKVYKFPGVRIDRLTIQFKKWNGNIFDFGTDNPPSTAPLNTVQTTVTFKITTLEPYVH